MKKKPIDFDDEDFAKNNDEPEADEEDFEENNEEEVEEDEEEYAQPMPKKPIAIKPVQSQQKSSSSSKKQTETYSAFYQPERKGIINVETKEVVGEDIHDLLAKVLNGLDEIKNMIGRI